MITAINLAISIALVFVVWRKMRPIGSSTGVVLAVVLWDPIFALPVALAVPDLSDVQLRARQSAALAYVPILALMILALGRIAMTKRILMTTSPFLNHLLMGIVGLGLIGIGLGWVNGNSLVFIASDAYVLRFIPVTLIALRQFRTANGAGFLFLLVCGFALVGSLHALQGQFAAITQSGWTRSAVAPLVLIVSAYLVTSNVRLNPVVRLLLVALFVVGIVSNALQITRSLWVMTGVTLVMWLIIDGRRAMGVSLVTLVPSALTLMVVLSVLLVLPTALLSSRFAIFLDPQLDPGTATRRDSAQSRVLEYQLVKREISDGGGGLNWMFGMGYGAEYRWSTEDPLVSTLANKKGSVEGASHAIHSEYVNIFFRTGLLGLTVYGLAYAVMALLLYRKVRDPRLSPFESVITKTALTYFIVRVVGSISVKMLFGLDMVLLIALAMALPSNKTAPQTVPSSPAREIVPGIKSPPIAPAVRTGP